MWQLCFDPKRDSMQASNSRYLKALFDSGNIDTQVSGSGDYFLRVNDSYIKLNNNFYRFLQIVKTTDDIDSLDVVDSSVKFDKLCALIKNKTRENRSDSYIYFKIKIIGRHLVNDIASCLVFLYRKAVFIPLFLVSLVASTFFYAGHFENQLVGLSYHDFIAYYIILILIMVLHEFGHAAACKFFGIAPNHIGFGFYVLFPVFYANVTSIWLLSKRRRLVVNIGGIYFQLIINFILIAISYHYSNDLLIKVVNVNFFVACFSLVPFLRNDGYWIYSDIFDLPNLSSKSRFYSLNVLKKAFIRKKQDVNFPLFIYSVGNSVFFLFIFAMLFKSLFNNLNNMVNARDAQEILMRGVFVAAMSFFFFMFFRKYAIGLYKLIKHSVNG